jgi:hypothetical protein
MGEGDCAGYCRLRSVRRLGRATHGPGLRAEPGQPRGASRGAGADSGAAPPRDRSDSLQPVARRLARRGLETATEGRNPDASVQHHIEAHRDQLEADEGLCRQLGAKPVEVVPAWLLGNPVVSTASYGPTSAGCRCSWTPRLWNDSTKSNQVWSASRPIRRFGRVRVPPVPASPVKFAA